MITPTWLGAVLSTSRWWARLWASPQMANLLCAYYELNFLACNVAIYLRAAVRSAQHLKLFHALCNGSDSSMTLALPVYLRAWTFSCRLATRDEFRHCRSSRPSRLQTALPYARRLHYNGVIIINPIKLSDEQTGLLCH